MNKIEEGAVEGTTNYLENVPANVLVGMNPINTDKVYWYSDEESAKI